MVQYKNSLMGMMRCGLMGVTLLAMSSITSAGQLNLGPDQYVEADGSYIIVPGYSVPSFAHWNDDGLMDLIVGEGSGSSTARVRVYLNDGTAEEPAFSDYFYAQSNGSTLTVSGSGCLGIFPRVVYWDDDQRKDLLVGLADGKIEIYRNIGTDAEPTFDGGTYVQVGLPGFKSNIDVGYRATPTMLDWNNDGRKDLIAGAIDGKVRVYIDESASGEPDFYEMVYAQANGVDLDVPSNRSSPEVADLDFDGRKDILLGNTNGEILLYTNVNTDADPVFGDYSHVEADGVPIDLTGSRSRPDIADWNNDGLPDLLVGTSDGLVHLFLNTKIIGDLTADGFVNINDIFELLGHWGPCPEGSDDCPDFNGDDVVDLEDIMLLITYWHV